MPRHRATRPAQCLVALWSGGVGGARRAAPPRWRRVLRAGLVALAVLVLGLLGVGGVEVWAVLR